MAEERQNDQIVAGLLAAAEARFGTRLDDESRALVRRQIETIAADSRALSAYPLTNDQEPEFVFTARREG